MFSSVAAKPLKEALCVPESQVGPRLSPWGATRSETRARTMKAILHCENPKGDLRLSGTSRARPYPVVLWRQTAGLVRALALESESLPCSPALAPHLPVTLSKSLGPSKVRHSLLWGIMGRLNQNNICGSDLSPLTKKRMIYYTCSFPLQVVTGPQFPSGL